MRRPSWIVPAVYILPLMLPIYWLLNMSFTTTNEVLGSFALWPHNFTLESYQKNSCRSDVVRRLRRSAHHAVIDTVVSVGVALPAAVRSEPYRAASPTATHGTELAS